MKNQLLIHSLLKEFCCLEGSTTTFLETCKGQPLKVNIVSQGLHDLQKRDIIKRMSVLYFEMVSHPVIYSESDIYLNAITDDEREGLASQVPIGRLFSMNNDGMTVTKRNITVSRIQCTPAMLKILNTDMDTILKKEYDCMIGTRTIGQFTEYFNEDTLRRL